MSHPFSIRSTLCVVPLFALACGGSGGTKLQDLATTTQDLATTTQDLATTTGDLATATHDLATTTHDAAVANGDLAVSTLVQGCGTADFVDHTSDTASVAVTPWDLSSTAPRCIKVKSGQTVTWAASGAHPLISRGGATPTPIPTTAQSTPQSVTFPNTGTFGFWCDNHTTQMQGAILVVSP